MTSHDELLRDVAEAIYKAIPLGRSTVDASPYAQAEAALAVVRAKIEKMPHDTRHCQILALLGEAKT